MESKKKGKSNCIKIIAFLLILLSIQENPIYAQEQIADINKKSLLVIVKEQEQLPHLENLIQSHYKEYLSSIETIEEANLLNITLTSELASKELLQDLKYTYQNLVQTAGFERIITLTKPPKIKSLPGTITNTKVHPAQSFFKASLMDSETNPFYSFQWDINTVTNNGESYLLQKGNHNVKIAIIDSGIDFNHPDIKENIISLGKSFIPHVQDTQDYLGHGTMVAGVIASNGNLMGVGPNLGIVPYKVFHTGSAESSWIIQAIIQAAKDDMDVINLSLSAYLSKSLEEDKTLIEAYEKALRYAKLQGSIVVASAGNDALDLTNSKEVAEQRGYPGDHQVHLPGGSKNVITVSSTSKENTLASYSNYGKITFAAPGGDYGPYFHDLQVFDLNSWVLVAYPTNLAQTPLSVNLGLPKGYELTVGSSLAAPKVSALTGLLIAEYEETYNKEPSPSYIKNLIKRGSIDRGKRGFDKEFGYGEINAVNSLNYIK
ncbi:S8 family peptidase [Cytobacillus firmus]|uniref:S8 family peptidase n=1 Tax=Cytobacillus firmus TaxID=1399 RepID=UPI003B9F8BE2